MRFITILLLLFSSSLFAAKDPIAWSVNRNFQNPVYTGRTYSVTYTFTSQLPATMTKPLTVTKDATPASDFSYSDNCTGLLLAPNQSCTVVVTLSPTTSGTKSIQLILGGYDNNKILIPRMTTTAQGESVQQASVYGTVILAMPTSTTAGLTQNYSFEFVNAKSTSVSISLSVTQSNGTPTYVTNCSSSLSGDSKCFVNGTYTPTTGISVQTVTATLTYGEGKTVTVSTSTNVSSTTGVVASFVGNESLPAEMVAGSQTIHVLFTNYGPGNVTMGANATPMSVTQGASVGSIVVTTNNCQNTALNLTPGLPPPACDIEGSFTASSVVTPTAVTVDTTASYTGGSTSIDTSTTVVSSMSSSRTFTIINNCDFPVFYSLNGGALPNSPTCSTDADCGNSGTYASCNTGNHTCYWKNYTPNGAGSGGNPYKLDAAGGGVTQNTITIASNSVDPNVLWSGNISASLNCDGTSTCLLADCDNAGGSAACSPGQGFSQPATQAEFTLNKNTSDSYDVEVINGYHLPISMQPGPYVNVNGYTCGTPGAFTATNGFGACNWANAAVPTQQSVYPGNGYYVVTSGGASCQITNPGTTCTGGTVCGLDLSFQQVCGNFLGYWTADQVCGSSNVPSEVQTYFQCNVPLNSLDSSLGFPAGSVLFDLMACAVPKGDTNTLYNSCYLNYSGLPADNQINCCGCIDWWTVGVGANSSAQSCTKAGQSTPQTDPVWNQYLQNSVQWLKAACPSAYTYPFDDATSGFSCTNTLPNQANSVGYTITFCAGNDGKPAGVNEGRTNP